MTPRDILLARIAYYKAEEQKATKGPWTAIAVGGRTGHWIENGDRENIIANLVSGTDIPSQWLPEDEANASVIVAARNSWPRILDKAQKDAEEHRPIVTQRGAWYRQCEWKAESCKVVASWLSILEPTAS